MTAKKPKTKDKLPLQQVNKHKVSARQWRKWPDIAQRVFNGTYDYMLANQDLFLHPKADASRDEYWLTTVHNASWVAADACKQALDDIVDGKGYMQVPA